MTHPADTAVESKADSKGKFAAKWRQARDKVIAAKNLKGPKGTGPDGFALSNDVVDFLKPSTDALARQDATKAASLAVNAAKVRDPARKKKNVGFKDGPAELIGEGGELCDDPSQVIVPRSKRGSVETFDVSQGHGHDRLSRSGLADGEQSAFELMMKMRAEEGVVLRQSRTPKPEEIRQLEEKIERVERGERAGRDKDGDPVPIEPDHEQTPIDFSPGFPDYRHRELPSLNSHQPQSVHSETMAPATSKLAVNTPPVEDPRQIGRAPPPSYDRYSQPLSPSRSYTSVKSSPPRKPEPTGPGPRQGELLSPLLPPGQSSTPVSPPVSRPSIPPKLQPSQSAHAPSIPAQLLPQQQPRPSFPPSHQQQHQMLPSNSRSQQAMPPPSYQQPSPRPRSSLEDRHSPARPHYSRSHTLLETSSQPKPQLSNVVNRVMQDMLHQRNRAHSHADLGGNHELSGISGASGPPAASRTVRSGTVSGEMYGDHSSTPSPAQSNSGARNSGPSLSSIAAAGIPTHRNPAQPKSIPNPSFDYSNRRAESAQSLSNSLHMAPYSSSISIHSPTPSVVSSHSSPALDDFTSRVSHMWRIFSLTAGRDGPMDRFSARQWLRGGVWWFVCARSFFEAVARKRSSPTGNGSQGDMHEPENITQQLMQGHVDLAKAVWVVDVVLPEIGRERDHDSRSCSVNGNSIQIQTGALRKQMEALAQSMGRHNLMPAHEVLIQGLDQLMWVRYPPSINLNLNLPGSTPDSGGGLLSLTFANTPSETVFEPLAVIPLADSPSRFCLFRGIGRANLVHPSSGEVVGPMPVVISVVRPRGRLRLNVLIAGQVEGISIVADGNDVSWGSGSASQQGNKSASLVMKVRVPVGTMEITLPDSEATGLRGMYDSFMRAVSPMTANTTNVTHSSRFGVAGLAWPEEVLWEGPVSAKVNYFPLVHGSSSSDSTTAKPPFPFAAGPHKVARFSVVALANRAGLRLCLADADSKAIQVLALNAPNPFPIRAELAEKGVKLSIFQNPISSPPTSHVQDPSNGSVLGNSGAVSWLVRITLVLSSSTSPRDLVDLLGAASQSRPRDGSLHSIHLDAFNIEPFYNRPGDSAPSRSRESADEIPCNGAAVVEEIPPSAHHTNGQPNGTLPRSATAVRLIMTHHSLHMRVTLSDRISSPIKFRLPVLLNPKPEIELLRSGNSDLSAVVERPEEPSVCTDPAAAAEVEWRSVLAKSCSPSLRLYRCSTMVDLHLLQASLTGWFVKYDGRPRSITFPRYSAIMYSGGTDRVRRPTISLRSFHHLEKDKSLSGSPSDKKAPVISFSTVGPNRIRFRFQLLQHRENPERFAGVVFFARREDGDGFGAVPPAWVVFGFRTPLLMNGGATGATGGGTKGSNLVEIGDPATFNIAGKKGWLHRDKDRDRDKGDKSHLHEDDSSTVPGSPSPHVAFSLAGSPPSMNLVRLRDVCVRAPGSFGSVHLGLVYGQGGVVTASVTGGVAGAGGSGAPGSVPSSPMGATSLRARESEDGLRTSLSGSAVSAGTGGGGLGLSGSVADSNINNSVVSFSSPNPSIASTVGSITTSAAGASGSGNLGETSFSASLLGGAVASRRESDMFATLDDGPGGGGGGCGATGGGAGTLAGTIADVLIGFDTPAERKELVDVLPQ